MCLKAVALEVRLWKEAGSKDPDPNPNYSQISAGGIAIRDERADDSFRRWYGRFVFAYRLPLNGLRLEGVDKLTTVGLGPMKIDLDSPQKRYAKLRLCPFHRR